MEPPPPLSPSATRRAAKTPKPIDATPAASRPARHASLDAAPLSAACSAAYTAALWVWRGSYTNATSRRRRSRATVRIVGVGQLRHHQQAAAARERTVGVPHQPSDKVGAVGTAGDVHAASSETPGGTATNGGFARMTSKRWPRTASEAVAAQRNHRRLRVERGVELRNRTARGEMSDAVTCDAPAAAAASAWMPLPQQTSRTRLFEHSPAGMPSASVSESTRSA